MNDRITINIITNNSCPNSVAFNAPLIAAKKSFADENVQLNFFTDISVIPQWFGRVPREGTTRLPKSNIFNSDVLFINSNVFRSYWHTDKGGIFSFLEEAKKAKQSIIWFDTTDSTWCTQFEVLPFVDKFLKGQILADKSRYLTPYRTGRIFTDTFDELYDTGEESVDYPAPDKQYLDKIGISWNTCFENYSESRYNLRNKIRRKITALVLNRLSTPFNVKFTAYGNSGVGAETPEEERRGCPVLTPSGTRTGQISCRVGLSHNRKSVVAHRKAIIELLKKRGVFTGKVSLPEYFEELRSSQIGVGPFGVGEITLRDFEIIICGAVLLKPDMSHMRTWPELFIPEVTCATHKWDLSDFDEKIDYLLNNPDKCKELADNARDTYQKALSEEGMEAFAARLISSCI